MKFVKDFKVNYLNNNLILYIIKILFYLKSLKNYFKTQKNIESDIINKYCNFLKKNLFEKKLENKKIILMDCCDIPDYIISNTILSSELKKYYGANIVSYGDFPRKGKINQIMNSMNIDHFLIKLDKKQNIKLEKIFKYIIKKLTNKNELYNLKLSNVSIGIDIYETILKCGNPTINFGTLEMYENIYLGLKYLIYFEDLFKKKIVLSTCLSDNTYITTGIITKLAYKYCVSVFHANPISINRTEFENQLHSRFKKYREYFNKLSKKSKIKAINNSKKLLSKRLKGKTKIKMFYQEKSAFTKKNIARQLNDNAKIKIIVTTHCFYDNPNAYGDFLFKDFYDWLIFVGKISEKIKKKYEIYIKPHRDYLPGTIEVLNEIKNKFTNLKIIDPETSFHQLKKEGAKISLTGYGSVGHELPLLGFLVINSGFNPHSNYSFNLHPKNKKDYKKILCNLDNHKIKVSKDEIYEFFYTHYTINNDDSFLFDSYEKYSRYVKFKMKSDECYSYFLKKHKIYLKKYKKIIADSIISNRCFSVEKILNNKSQLKLKKTNLSRLIKNEKI